MRFLADEDLNNHIYRSLLLKRPRLGCELTLVNEQSPAEGDQG